MMNRSSALIALIAAGTAGCGNLSHEDLLFLSGVPPKEAVEIRPAGANSQAGGATLALHEICEEVGDLRCNTHDIAEKFNTGVFNLLDMIDNVVRQPPTERRKGRRVWGPHFGDNNTTFRFEMIRLEDERTFAFCLHAAPGQIDNRKAEDVSCETDLDDSGLALLISGQFTPGDEQGARVRSGVGTIILELPRIPDMADAGRRMVIDFDNTDGRTEVAVNIEDGRLPGIDDARVPFNYAYAREADESGRFHLETVVPADNEIGVFYLLTIDTAWLSDQSGRAEAQGARLRDLANPVATYTQCWNAEQADVFVEYVTPDGTQTAGDEQLCSIQGPLIE
jgi:hypothetical protein